MAIYKIPECNVEQFRKKIQTIEKKCRMYGNEFVYNELQYVYEETQVDTETVLVKFLEVEVAGIAKVHGWTLVAELIQVPGLQRHIVNYFDESAEIPDEYLTADIHCDHCSTKRHRKNVFVIYNEYTKEFKQIGRSCLQEYTSGLSGECAAYVSQFFNTLRDGSCEYFNISQPKMYYSVDECLRIAGECFNKFGWHKKSDEDSTYSEVYDIYNLIHNRIHTEADIVRIQDRMKAADFNADNYADDLVKLKAQLANYDGKYGLEPLDVRNIITNEYVDVTKLGMLVYLPVIYDKIMKAQEQEKLYKERNAQSSHVGNVGDRIDVDIQSCRFVSSFESYYGYTYIYKFTDVSGNIYTWFASSPICNNCGESDLDNIIHIKGTVKDHTEYKGAKETVLTRCKVTYKEVE